MVVELVRQFFARVVWNEVVVVYATRRLSEARRRQTYLTVPTCRSAKSVLYTVRTAQISVSATGTIRSITSRPATPKTHSKRTINITADEIEENEITMRKIRTHLTSLQFLELSRFESEVEEVHNRKAAAERE
jgi:hypothetical protein